MMPEKAAPNIIQTKASDGACAAGPEDKGLGLASSPSIHEDPDYINRWLRRTPPSPLFEPSTSLITREEQAICGASACHEPENQRSDSEKVTSSTQSPVTIHFDDPKPKKDPVDRGGLPIEYNLDIELEKELHPVSWVNNVLKEITFLEGASSLKSIPKLLIDQLAFAMVSRLTTRPDCVRTVWRNSVYSAKSSHSVKAWFADMDTGEELLTARYAWAEKGQIIVVQCQHGLLPHGADTAIINYCKQFSTTSTIQNGMLARTTTWEIWEPQHESQMAHYIKRISLSRQHGNKRQKSNSTDGENWSPKKKQGLSLSDMKTSQARAGRSTTLHDHRLTTQQPLSLLHNTGSRSQTSHTEPNQVDSGDSSRDGRKKRHMGEADLDARLLEQVVPGPSTPPLKTLDVPTFVFKKLDGDLQPRTRSLRVCNSAEKLFANAVVAGVALKSTLLLNVHVAGQEPITVVRGDKDDFDTILNLVEGSMGDPMLLITVTAVDLDL